MNLIYGNQSMKLLEYPLNKNKILRKKFSIKKELLNKKDFIYKNVAILGGSTTSEIKIMLEIFLLNIGIKANFYESKYNQFYEEALFMNEALIKFQPDIVYIHTTNVNIMSYPNIEDDENKIASLLDEELKKYKAIWNSILGLNCAIIQNNFDFLTDRSLGNLDCYDIHGKTHFLNQLNNEFHKSAREIKQLYIHDINYLSSYIGLNNWFDKSLWYRAKYAMSMDAIVELAFSICKIIASIFAKTKKCLVLDLDNTCWGGVIGDDGISNIQIGLDTATAESHTAFQKYVKELNNRGVTLAVCSKNDFLTAKEGFSHPDTVLKFDDFTSFQANWEHKHHSIITIAQEININTDSLIFVDDNAVERDLVRSQVSNIEVPDIGEDIVYYIDHIDKNGYFEPVSLLSEDINRNQYYQENKLREEKQVTFKSYDDFLVDLKMVAEIKSFSQFYTDRIGQLINKTNQFNLTTRRYTVGEIENITIDNEYIKLYGKLTDKYGSNGLISVIIGQIKEQSCYIDLFIMSCRVLKRGMEYAMLDALIKQCEEKNLYEIIGYYFKTPKNAMVSNLYNTFGFHLIFLDEDKSIWKLIVKDYQRENRFKGVIYE
ncbi:HAD-IIIC family phosphatase [Sulfurimonas sp.]